MPILLTLFEIVSNVEQFDRALEVVKEYIELHQKIREAQPLEPGVVDGELARALFSLHDVHAKCGNRQECLDAFNECDAVMTPFKATPEADPALARLKEVLDAERPKMNELKETLKAEKAERQALELARARELETRM